MHAPEFAPVARGLLVLFCSASLISCSDDGLDDAGGGEGRDTGSGRRDAGPSDISGMADTGIPPVVPTDCSGALTTNILNLAPGTVFDPEAAFFGGSLWVGFSDANTKLSIVNLNCNGQVIRGPMVLDATEPREAFGVAIHPLPNSMFVSWLLGDQRGGSGRQLKSALINAEGVAIRTPQDVVITDGFVVNPIVIPRGESFSILARVLRRQSDNSTFLRNYNADGQSVGPDTNIPRPILWLGARGAKGSATSTTTVYFVDAENGGLGSVSQDFFIDAAQVTTGPLGPSEVNLRYFHDPATGLSFFDTASLGQFVLNLETPQRTVMFDYPEVVFIRSFAGQGDEAVALIQSQMPDGELTLLFFERVASQWALAEQRVFDSGGTVAFNSGDLVAVDDGNYFVVWPDKDTGDLKGRLVRR